MEITAATQSGPLQKLGAGETATLLSGGDARLRGATVEAQQIVAAIAGDLRIESLQDTSRYNSRQSNAGFSVSIPVSGTGTLGGSVSGGQSRIDSRYASVNEQAGLKAGDGGFQVDAQGNTDGNPPVN